jgi:hypothetical protein
MTEPTLDLSDALICEACGYPIHRAVPVLARMVEQVRLDSGDELEDIGQCFRCSYRQEHARAEMLAGLLKRRHALDPLEVAEALAQYND